MISNGLQSLQRQSVLKLLRIRHLTLQKLLADVCPTQFGRDKIDCSHAKCRHCCFYFCNNFHFPTNKKEEKTIAAVIYYKKLNILSALINIYLNFKISTSSSQTIPFQFLYFLSRPNCVGQTSAKSFWSVKQHYLKYGARAAHEVSSICCIVCPFFLVWAFHNNIQYLRSQLPVVP